MNQMKTSQWVLVLAVLAIGGVITKTPPAYATCEKDSNEPLDSRQQQSLAARNFANSAKFRVAEGGAERLKERQLAADGSDRLKPNQYADIGYDYSANLNAHYSMD